MVGGDEEDLGIFWIWKFMGVTEKIFFEWLDLGVVDGGLVDACDIFWYLRGLMR